MESKRNTRITLGLTNSRWILRRIVNTLVSLIVIVATLGLRYGLFSPVMRGFHCRDASISYPVKEESVSSKVLFIGCILCSLTFILLNNLYSSWPNFKAKTWLKQSGEHYFVFLLGFAMSALISEAGKLSSGVLRPNFLAVCKPDVNCSAESSSFTYHENYSCKGNPDDVLDARMSFPSGHAAVASFTAVFLIVYIQAPTTKNLNLFRPFLQVLLFLAAYLICLTRISDFVHHGSDVIVGALLGGGVAVCVFYSLLCFRWPMKRELKLSLCASSAPLQDEECSLPAKSANFKTEMANC